MLHRSHGWFHGCFLFGLALVALGYLTGCASIAQEKRMSAFDSLYDTGQYQQAADVELALKDDDDPIDTEHLLCTLQAAAALRCVGNFEQSNLLFDDGEAVIKYFNEQWMTADAGQMIGSVLVNDAILDYQGAEYDGVMINTYKALNFWTTGQYDLARVEFNRALDRQRRAKERHAAKIQKMQAAVAEQQAKENQKVLGKSDESDKSSQRIDVQKNLDNPKVQEILDEKYSNLENFKAYPDFINPFTTYMAGLFFMSQQDFNKAATLLKESYGMVGDNKFVQEDFQTVENRLDGKRATKKHFVWVVFENGLGPEKKEFRVDLPLFILTDQVKYTGIALPRLKTRPRAYDFLTIQSGAGKAVNTQLVGDMDRVIQTEFRKEIPLIVTRAISSTIFKTVGQYLLQRELGDIGGILGSVYQLATTSADIRMWTALPKEFQLAKVPCPPDGRLTVSAPDGTNFTIDVPPQCNTLAYIKIPQTAVMPATQIIPLDPNAAEIALQRKQSI